MTQPFPLGSGCTYEPHVPATFRIITPPARAQMRRFASCAPNNGGFPKPQAGGSSPLGGTNLPKGLTPKTGRRNLGAKVHREPSGGFVPVSGTVAVFHNLCGRRTVIRSCGRDVCRSPFLASPPAPFAAGGAA